MKKLLHRSLRLRLRMLTLPVLAVAVSSACIEAEQASAVIEGVAPLAAADGCVVGPGNTFVAGGTLDIGFDANSANQFVMPLQVASNLPATLKTQDVTEDLEESPNYQGYGNVDSNIITFNAAEVFFTTDADRDNQTQLQNAGTPINENTARVTAVAGTVFNENTQLLTESIVFATGITREDAALLQGEDFVAQTLNAGGLNARVRIIVNILLRGKTSGNAEVSTPSFSFPVELCRGCIIDPAQAQCPQGQFLLPVDNTIDFSCTPGQDIPLTCRAP